MTAEKFTTSWSEANVNPEVWGHETYLCKVTTKEGKEVYGYLRHGTNTLTVPLEYNGQIPDKSLHLGYDLTLAHITFENAKKRMAELNFKVFENKMGPSVFAELGILQNDKIGTQTGVIRTSAGYGATRDANERYLVVGFDNRNLMEKISVSDLANRLGEGLEWNIEPVSATELTGLKS